MTEDGVNGVNGVFYCFFVSHGCKLPDFVGLWLSYNWAWSGPGAAVQSDVNKPKQKKKREKKKLHINKLSSWLEDEKQVEQNHRFQCEPSRALMIKEDCFSFDVTKTSTD